MLKARVKNLLFLLSDYLPQDVVRLPYLLLFCIVNFFCKCLGVKVYGKNSFYTKKMVLGVSDLDLVFLIDSFNEEKIGLIRRIHTFVPIVSEVSILDRTYLEDFVISLNRYEALRDPFLKDFLNTKERPYEKMIFLLHMFNADFSNLIGHIHGRREKWSGHLNEKLDTHINFNQFLIVFKKASGVDQVGLSFEKYCIVKKKYSLSDEKRYFQALSENLLLREFLIFDFSSWMSFAVQSGEMSLQKKFFCELDVSLLKMTLENVMWEIWGLFTQVYLLKDRQTLINHLDHIISLLNQLKAQDPRINTELHLELLAKLRSIARQL